MKIYSQANNLGMADHVRLDKLSALYYIIFGSLRQDALLCLTHACLVMSHSREPYKYIRSPGGTIILVLPFLPLLRRYP